MLKIYLTNLGKYNEGELVGEWVELPIDEDELEAVKERIGISDEPDKHGRYYEEWFITDYETDVDGLKVGEYDDLDELNELAERLDDLEDDEETALQAYLLNGCDFPDALDKAEEGNYTIYSDCDSMTDLAYIVVDECGYLNDVPETVARYFDYEAFGRDLDIEGTYYQIGDDMIELY